MALSSSSFFSHSSSCLASVLFSLRPYCEGPINEILSDDGEVVDTMTFDGMRELYQEVA